MTNPLNVQWPQEASTLQHWAALSKASRATPARALTNRLADMEKRIEEADAAYVVLMNDGIQFSQSTGPTHLQQWKAAIDAFREAIS